MIRQGTRFEELRRSVIRRSGIFPGRRFALALALAAGVAVCWPAVAAADTNTGQQINVTVWPPGGGIKTESVSLATLESSPAKCPLYTGPPIELYRQGGTQQPDQALNPKEVWSLATVLGCLSPPVSGVLSVDVEQSGAPELSPNSQLVPADLASPSDFPNTSEVPLIYSDGTNIVYDRPWRGGADANAPDQVITSNPSPFMLEAFQRRVLGATVMASPNPVAVGGTVSFSAQAAGMGPGVTYTWNFGGAAPQSTLPNPTVTYSSAGSYNVIVQVTDTGGDVAQSPPLVVQVGSTPPTSTNPAAPPTGPNKSNGNTPGGVPGPKPRSGTSGRGRGGTGKGAGSTGTGGHTHASGAQGSGTGGTGNGSGSSGSGSSSAGGATGSRAGGRGQGRHAGGSAVPLPKAPATVTTGPSLLITGRLISDVKALPAGGSPLVHPASGSAATAPAARRRNPASVLPYLAAGLAVFLLFSLGAGRELSWGRRCLVLLFGPPRPASYPNRT